MVPSNGTKEKTNGTAKRVQQMSIETEKPDLQSKKKPRLPECTDYSRWRMLAKEGRQTWHYLEDDAEVEEWPQSMADKYYLGLPLV
jgi:lanosterol synthase